jgi:hypothetical protein
VHLLYHACPQQHQNHKSPAPRIAAMSMMHCAVYWLCLLHAALATVVDASHPNNQDRSRLADVSGRHTGCRSAGATHSFAGELGRNCSIFPGEWLCTDVSSSLSLGSLYVVTHSGEGNLSFSINNEPPPSYSYWQNDTYWIGFKIRTLCKLDGVVQHTLTITHTDVDEFWLHFDYLESAP